MIEPQNSVNGFFFETLSPAARSPGELFEILERLVTQRMPNGVARHGGLRMRTYLVLSAYFLLMQLCCCGQDSPPVPVPDPISTPGAGVITDNECRSLREEMACYSIALGVLRDEIAAKRAEIGEFEEELAEHEADFAAALARGNGPLAADYLLLVTLTRRRLIELRKELSAIECRRDDVQCDYDDAFQRWLAGGCLGR